MSRVTPTALREKAVPAYELGELEHYRFSAKLAGWNRQTLLLGRLAGRDSWTLPGGGFDPEVDTTCIDTVWREAEEEGFDKDNLVSAFGISKPDRLRPAYYIGADLVRPIEKEGKVIQGVIKLVFEASAPDGLYVPLRTCDSDEVEDKRFFGFDELVARLHPHELGLISAYEQPFKPAASINKLPLYAAPGETMDLTDRRDLPA